jgi:protocatechuate 3,4-dioxygenase beta subunit
MKNSLTLVCIAFLVGTCFSQNVNDSEEIQALYEYSEADITSTADIPEFKTKEQQLKITGIIYEQDGVTPAKDVILYIYQPDENGRYDMQTENDKRFVHHRAWIKTDANGAYTFNTFMPGTVHRSHEFKHIHAVVKAPNQEAYQMNAMLFDNDPLLTKSCRKKLAKKGMADSILKVEDKEGIFISTKNIVLQKSNQDSK